MIDVKMRISGVVSRVARFCQIWLNFKSLWAFWGFIYYLAKFWTYFGIFMLPTFLANFQYGQSHWLVSIFECYLPLIESVLNRVTCLSQTFFLVDTKSTKDGWKLSQPKTALSTPVSLIFFPSTLSVKLVSRYASFTDKKFLNFLSDELHGHL